MDDHKKSGDPGQRSAVAVLAVLAFFVAVLGLVVVDGRGVVAPLAQAAEGTEGYAICVAAFDWNSDRKQISTLIISPVFTSPPGEDSVNAQLFEGHVLEAHNQRGPSSARHYQRTKCSYGKTRRAALVMKAKLIAELTPRRTKTEYGQRIESDTCEHDDWY